MPFTSDQRTLAPNIVRFGTPFNSFTTTIPITFSSSGDNIIVPAVAGQRIFLYRMLWVATSATNITFKDGASTSLSGAMAFGANGSTTLDFQGEAWYATSAGNALILNSSNAVQVSGTAWYVQV